MRQSGFWRRCVLLVLIASLAGVSLPGFAVQHTVAGATFEDGASSLLGQPASTFNKNKENDKSSKDNGKHKGQEKKDKDNKKNNGNGNSGKHQQPIDEADTYTVNISCLFDGGSDQTTCTFTGIAPESGKKIGQITVPEVAVCADVLGGTADYVHPDPKTHVTGYRSHGSEAAFSLILAGEVATSGSTTYWFKVGGSIFPGQGAGLACAASADASPETENPAVATPDAVSGSTGALVVTTYLCAQVPDDPQTFDWFGSCNQGGNFTFALDEAGAGPAGHYVLDTPAEGITVFGDLVPGLYHLELPGEKWCHAESDGVNSEGNLQVAAGKNTQVWIFLCGMAGS